MICVVQLVSVVADLTYALAKVDPGALTGAAAATELLLVPEAGVVASQPDALPGRYV